MRRLFAFASLALTAIVIACGDNGTAPHTPGALAEGAVPPLLATATDSNGLSITTDKDDYQPGDTVWLSGAGWQPGDTIDIVLSDEPMTHAPHHWWVPVGADGTFRDSTYLVDVGDLGVTFTLIATSRSNPAQSLTVQFTDAELLTAELVAPNNDVTVTQGSSASFTISLSATGAIKCIATPATPATAKVHTVFAISAGGMVSSSTLSAAVDFFGGAPLPAPNNCIVAWTGSPTAAASVSAAATTPIGDYTITLSQSAGSVALTNPSGPGGSLDDAIATLITVHVIGGANAIPNAPANPAQFKSDGATSIPTGGLTNEATVVLKGTVSDPDAGNTVKLQVEVQPVGTPFTNTVTSESALLASGSTAAVTVSGLLEGSYHWQARTVDNSGAPSAWISYASNLETETDFQVDLTPPTVTINQALGQADPTNASPINFTVVFSEPVSDFVTGDVTLGGTAGATTAAVTGSGTTYNVAVSGMTIDGTVIASIDAGKATDAAGNPSEASTSGDNTVTYDITPPSVTINQAAGQADPTNDSPINFTVVFSEAVTGFATGDVTLGGTAGATTGTVTGGPITFNVAVNGMTGDGTVIATILAGKATDLAGNPSLASTSTDNTVTYDNTPPVVSAVQATPNPSNGTGNIVLSATATDLLTNIISAEYNINSGPFSAMNAVDGNYDDELVEHVTVTIAASTLTEGSHTLCVRATDKATNRSADAGACTVLIVDKTPPAISNFIVSPNPVAVNTNFTISATFIDALTKVTNAQYSLGGVGGPWVNLPSAGDGYNSMSEDGTITLSLPNADVLDVCVRSIDQAGNQNQPPVSTNPIQCAFLAVYDPTAGFVTGGGWFDSPTGACPVFCSNAAGKATFGFVSKYLTQKDKTNPVLTGNTEFQFHAGNMNFKSTTYEWLVVSGNGVRAQYKGTGTVNGVSGYGFLLTALDGPDKLRMKIWDASGTIYDNQWGSADSGDDATLLSGGSIIIHVPKKSP